ncbi:MAG: hypothetical protein SNH56_03235 [Rikenellaceae bacterium]
MKTNRLFLAFALIVGVAVSSCTKEQTELNLSDIAGEATIYGQVMYNQGVMVQNGVVYNDYLVILAEQEVYIDLDLSNFKSGASGVERYSTMTDEFGNYSITIPVGQNSISDEVDVASFVGVYGEYVNGEYCQYDDAIYQSASPTSFSVSNGDNKLVNVTVSDTPIFAPETIDRPVNVLGTVEVDAEKRSLDDFYNIIDIIKGTDPYDNGEVIITLSNTSGSDSRTIQYTLSVDDGEYDEYLYFYSSWSYDDVLVTLSMEDVEVSDSDKDSSKFLHYYVVKGNTTASYQYLSGTFSLDSGASKQLYTSTTKESVCEFSTVHVSFTPSGDETIKGITYNDTDYEYYNPMGW